MIKGINRQLIEITDVGSEYYERALLIVRPEYCDIQNAELEKEAKKILKNVGTPSISRKRQKVFQLILKLSCAAAIGAGIAVMFMSV